MSEDPVLHNQLFEQTPPGPKSRAAGLFNLDALAARLGYHDDCWELSALACPSCGRIYLHEADLGEVWLDPEDLHSTVAVSAVEPFACAGCEQVLYVDALGRVIYRTPEGELATHAQVSREALQASPWVWALG